MLVVLNNMVYDIAQIKVVLYNRKISILHIKHYVSISNIPVNELKT